MSLENQKHDHQREKKPSNGNPCNPKTNKQVNSLEDCKHCNRLERSNLQRKKVQGRKCQTTKSSGAQILKSKPETNRVVCEGKQMKRIKKLLVSSARSCEEQQNPFPELVTR